MNPYVANIVGALTGGGLSFDGVTPFPTPTTVTPTVAASLTAPADTTAPVNPTPYIETKRAGVNISSTELSEDAEAGNEALSANALTKEQIENYMKGTILGVKAISSLANGFTSNISYKMQASNKEWQAQQNERSARMLLANQREINRAAQMGANVYRVQGAQTKSNQKVAMAQTGFAVGKGIYRNTLNTTDTRVNYNTSAVILKAELQNAELTRRAGQYEAEAIINRADASIARKQGKAALWQGVGDAAVYAIASGAYFYYGNNPVGE